MISITVLIIIVTSAISLAAFNNPLLMQRFLMNPYQVFHRKQFYRLVTSGFIHGSWIHLGFNMFTFYFFGRIVEAIFGQILGGAGSIVFIVFYLSAIIISDLPVAYKNRADPSYNSLGASGGVSAMVFASILYMPLNEICIYGILCLPGFILGLLYVIYSYYQGKRSDDGINHEAHLYGALYGLVFAVVIYPPAASGFLDQITQYSIF